ATETNDESVGLLGVPATHPETGYGWMEVEAEVSTETQNGLLRVKRFWEKPSLHLAMELLDRGCVWNTFVMLGRAGAFLDMIEAGAPELWRAFEPIRNRPAEVDSDLIERIYASIAPADFSRLVLSATPESLRILCLGDVGWS